MRQINISAQEAGATGNKGSADVPIAPATVGAAVTGVAALPEAFERYPQGANIVAGLLVFGMVCWVLVTWLKHRRS